MLNTVSSQWFEDADRMTVIIYPHRTDKKKKPKDIPEGKGANPGSLRKCQLGQR